MNLLQQELIYHIEKIKESNILVIVEGKKDRKALEEYGITNIQELNKPLTSIIDNISKTESNCIILTDLDKKGKNLFGILKLGLEKQGVKINIDFRQFLFAKTKLRNIEGLTNHFKDI